MSKGYLARKQIRWASRVEESGAAVGRPEQRDSMKSSTRSRSAPAWSGLSARAEKSSVLPLTSRVTPFQGYAVQPHPQPDAIVQSDPNLLPVVHVVVAVVDAAAVSTRSQFFLNDVFQRSPFRHVEPCHPGHPVAVQFDGGIGAVQRTVQATQGCPGGCVAGIEFRQSAFRRDFLRPSSCQPKQEIRIMAAFGQENGSGKVFPGP